MLLTDPRTCDSGLVVAASFQVERPPWLKFHWTMTVVWFGDYQSLSAINQDLREYGLVKFICVFVFASVCVFGFASVCVFVFASVCVFGLIGGDGAREAVDEP